MKTFLDYLIESKVDDEYVKNFSSIDRDIFNSIIKMDPKTQLNGNEITSIGFGSKQLLLPKYKSGETDFLNKADIIKNALEKYYPNIAKYPKFNEFRSVADFLKFMEDPDNAGIEKVEKEDPITTLYNKYYNDIDRADFDKIIAIDPQTTNTKIGEIAKNLLLPKFRSGDKDFLNNSRESLKACNIYYDDRSKLPTDKQQLSSYNSVAEFIKYMIEGPESALVTALKDDDTIDAETHRPVKDNFEVVVSTRDYDIIEPKSHMANEKIEGSNSSNRMNWCTGWNGNYDHWDHYVREGRKRLFCFMHKTRNRGSENRPINWQIATKNNHVTDFLDGNDRTSGFAGGTCDEQFYNFLLAQPDICLAIKDKDPFDKIGVVKKAVETVEIIAGKPVIVNNQEDVAMILTNNLSALIEKAIINIEKIPPALFAGAIRLKDIEFSENVKEIGAQAFKSCVNLPKLTLPESLKIIGVEAFANCRMLTGSVRIPNSVEEIRTRAFHGDRCKLKIDKDRTTKIRFDIRDKTWVNSHVQSIKI